VAYGANGAFFYRGTTNSIVCNHATFGDLIQGTAKASTTSRDTSHNYGSTQTTSGVESQLRLDPDNIGGRVAITAGLRQHKGTSRNYGSTHTTKVSSLSAALAFTSQHPPAGKSRPLA
jgi:hypothetical protein